MLLTAAPIKIGYFGDLSGPTFKLRTVGDNGVLMAVVEINEGGGINGRKIDVVIDDDHGSPNRQPLWPASSSEKTKWSLSLPAENIG